MMLLPHLTWMEWRATRLLLLLLFKAAVCVFAVARLLGRFCHSSCLLRGGFHFKDSFQRTEHVFSVELGRRIARSKVDGRTEASDFVPL